jgi:DNA-binding response OmpR family regulator
MKILIAEDESVARLSLGAQLKALGHEVIAARDGEEAWELFGVHGPSILITDWMMPKIDGLELCRLIRSGNRAKYTFIIMLTALSGKGSYLEGMKAGADDFVTKPFDGDELSARLRVAERILSLQAEVTQLEGLLPICSYCKKIRDDNNLWQPVDQYITRRTEASFSHGICPECYENRVKPELEQLKVRRYGVKR